MVNKETFLEEILIMIYSAENRSYYTVSLVSFYLIIKRQKMDFIVLVLTPSICFCCVSAQSLLKNSM